MSQVDDVQQVANVLFSAAMVREMSEEDDIQNRRVIRAYRQMGRAILANRDDLTKLLGPNGELLVSGIGVAVTARINRLIQDQT